MWLSCRQISMPKREHMEMMQQQMQQGEQAVAPGQGNNVPQGSEQGNLEGGVT